MIEIEKETPLHTILIFEQIERGLCPFAVKNNADSITPLFKA